jgi:hypothetical protein
MAKNFVVYIDIEGANIECPRPTEKKGLQIKMLSLPSALHI